MSGGGNGGIPLHDVVYVFHELGSISRGGIAAMTTSQMLRMRHISGRILGSHITQGQFR